MKGQGAFSTSDRCRPASGRRGRERDSYAERTNKEGKMTEKTIEKAKGLKQAKRIMKKEVP